MLLPAAYAENSDSPAVSVTTASASEAGVGDGSSADSASDTGTTDDGATTGAETTETTGSAGETTEATEEETTTDGAAGGTDEAADETGDATGEGTSDSDGTSDAAASSTGEGMETTQPLMMSALAAEAETLAAEESTASQGATLPSEDGVGAGTGPLATVTSSWAPEGAQPSGTTRTYTVKYTNKEPTAITNARIWHQSMAAIASTSTYTVTCQSTGTAEATCPTNLANNQSVTTARWEYFNTFAAIVDLPSNSELTFTIAITTTAATDACADSTSAMIGGWARFSRKGFTVPDDIEASASNAGTMSEVTQCSDGLIKMTNNATSPGPVGSPSRVLSGDSRTFTVTWENTSETETYDDVPVSFSYYVPYTGQVTQATWSCSTTSSVEGYTCPEWATQSEAVTINHDNAGEESDEVLKEATATSAGEQALSFQPGQKYTFTITLATTINNCTMDGYLRVQTYAKRGAASVAETNYRSSAPSELVEIGCSTWMLDEDFDEASLSDSGWLGIGNACLTLATTSASNGLGKCSSSTRTPSTNFTIDDESAGYIQLTDDNTNQTGAILYNRALPSKNGLVIEFTQYQYGNSNHADGIGFFLTDGAYSLTSTGAGGGALGYANKSSGNGLAHAYLGVGFDVYGNFADTSNDITPQCPGRTNTKKANSITVRGPGNKTTGYCTVGATYELSGKTLYATYSKNWGQSDGDAIEAALTASELKTRITVYPLKDDDTTQRVTVEVDFGEGYYTTVQDVEMTTGAPDTIKFGLLGSTGSYRDAHLIGDLRVGTVLPMYALTVEKSVTSSASDYNVGGSVSYTFQVINSSAEPIYNVTLADPLVLSISCTGSSTPNTIGTITGNATVECAGSYTVTASDRDVGQIENTVTVRGSTSNVADADLNLFDADTATVVVNPTAEGATRSIQPGGTATFQILDDGSTPGLVLPDDASAITISLVTPSGATEQNDSITVSGQGTWSIDSDNTVTFAAAQGFTGTATLDYTATNAYSGTDTATLSVVVNTLPKLVCTADQQRASDRY